MQRYRLTLVPATGTGSSSDGGRVQVVWMPLIKKDAQLFLYRVRVIFFFVVTLEICINVTGRLAVSAFNLLN
jgi:hypothetical protein